MKVVNVRTAVRGSYVYIGRKGYGFEASYWANEFLEGRDGTRLEVIQKFKQLLWKRMQNASFCKKLLELDGHDLGCWCTPLPCHGGVLIAAVEWLKKENSKLDYLSTNLKGERP